MRHAGVLLLAVLSMLAGVALHGCMEYVPVVAAPVATFLYIEGKEDRNARIAAGAAAATLPPTPTPTPTTLPTVSTITLSDGRVLSIACPPTQPDLDCDDFPCQEDSRRFIAAMRAVGLDDCHMLDADGDGVCNALDTTCP